MLNKNGKMIASSAHDKFSSRSEVDAWIKHELYTTGKVWYRVEINGGALFLVRKFKELENTSNLTGLPNSGLFAPL
jgi:hypothetical protein